MAYDVIHKNSTVAGTPPTASEIEVGEIAINAADAELYTKDTDGAINAFSNNATVATKAAFTQSGTGAVQRTIAAKLQDVVSVKDFGADPTGSADSTNAFAAALATDREVYVPIGTYKVNNLAIPDGAIITGEKGTISDETYPILITDQVDGAVFVNTGQPSYIKISHIAARTSSKSVTGASFFRMTNPGVNMGQYLEFDDVQTYRGFDVSYDGYFIFCQWKNCFDGYVGTLSNSDYHAFIRSAPDDPNASGIGQTNINIVRDCKIFQAKGTIPNRAGTTQTNGAASVILAYGALWSFVNTDFEAFTSSAAVIARGVKDVMFESCWFESVAHTHLVKLENEALTVGQIVSYPVSFKSCNFNLNATTQYLIDVATDSTPIPDGLMEWYSERIVFDSCNFGSIISGGKISNQSQQVLILNGRQDGDNSNGFPAFLDQGRFVATKDKDGNLLNDTANAASYIKMRRVSLGTYGDTTIGGWQVIDTDNNRTVAQAKIISYNSGTNGEIQWSTNVSNSLTPFVTATHTGRYFRFDSTTGGIQFNGDTAAANALDDYEEGNYNSAAIIVAGGTVVTGSEVGRYVKIGKLVHYSFSFDAGLSNAPAAATVFINLPFVALSATRDAAGGGVLRSINSLAVHATVIQGTSTAELRDLNTGSLLTNTDLGINSNVIKTFSGTVTYRTA